MTKTQPENFPPKLQMTASGEIDKNSLADLLEWFLNYDVKTQIMRHPHVKELFEWKQADDAARGVAIYPFEDAEARFAVGIFQTISENDTEEKLRRRITDVLQALGDAKQTREDFVAQYKLETGQGASFVAESQKTESKEERRIFLTSAWFEALCTAEARFLGWIYQEIYGKPFQISE